MSAWSPWLRAGRLALALSLGVSPAARGQDFASHFWWLRVVEGLTAPLDVASSALLVQVLPFNASPIQPAGPIADPATLAIDAQLPAIPRAARALAPYISAAHSVTPAELMVPTSPWFLQTALAIKALRLRAAIRNASDCGAVLRMVMDSALSRPDLSRNDPGVEVFTAELRSVSCSPGARLYARAAALLSPTDADTAGAPGANPAPATGSIGRVPYNTFLGSPLPISRCRTGDSLPPVWLYSNGSAVALAGATTRVGRLLADGSGHYPAILVKSGSRDSVYGVSFTGTLYQRSGAGVLEAAGRCE